MKSNLLLTCAFAAGLAGCGYGSVNPIFVSSELQEDDRILGTWQDPDSGEKATIARAGDEGYLITYVEEDGKSARFHARLGKLAGRMAFDLVPVDDWNDSPDIYKSLLLPLHGLVIIDSVGEFVRFGLLEPDTIRRFLAQNPSAAKHIMQENLVLLTGSTAELQAFFGGLLARDGILGEEAVWQRVAR